MADEAAQAVSVDAPGRSGSPRRGRWVRLLTRSFAVLVAVIALIQLDRAIMARVGKKSEGNRFRENVARIIAHGDGTAVIFGSSTTGQWLKAKTLAKHLGVKGREVLGATITGCHPSCTWNFVRQLLHEGRHYNQAFVGVSHYQMCERVTRKRVHEETEGLPIVDLPRVMATHALGQHPARAFAHFLGVSLSQTYADAFFVQAFYAAEFFGEKEEALSHRWYWPAEVDFPEHEESKWKPYCGYGDAETKLEKTALTLLLDDLGSVADRTYLLLLPDRELAEGGADVERRWKLHREFIGELVDERSHVTLIDLSKGKHVRPKYFRDGVHLTGAGARLQRAAFAKALKQSRGS